MMKLVLGNKNYSSWSLRPWLLLTYFQVPFQEHKISLAAADMHEQMRGFCPNYKVPVLLDDNLKVWDSMAICEYINEQYLQERGWPKNIKQRARARAVCAEMHSGFTHLRTELPMNCRRTPAAVPLSKGLRQDIDRIIELWQVCLSAVDEDHLKEGRDMPFLFGHFSIADAFFMPVVSRFSCYQIEVPDDVRHYMQQMLALPAYQLWLEQAIAESETIAAAEL